MTNTYSAELTPIQILNSIYYWINQDTWAPGVAFPSGPQLPTIDQTPEADDPHEGDFFFSTTNQHLYQLQIINQTLTWVDLGTSANAITWCGTTVPSSGSGNELDLFNKYDSGEIFQKIDSAWRNIGSNRNGLPLSVDALNFTDASKTWRSVNLGLLLVDAGSSPLLATDQGFIVKKDLSAGGFIATNQGEVWIGHGRENGTDIPKIIMDHASLGYHTLYLRQRLWDGQIGNWTVTTPANLDLGNLTVEAGYSIAPSSDGTSSVGLAAKMFQNMYANNLVIGNYTSHSTRYITLANVDSAGGNSGLILNFNTSGSFGAIIPDYENPTPSKTMNLGDATHKWTNIYCTNLTADSLIGDIDITRVTGWTGADLVVNSVALFIIILVIFSCNKFI